MWGEPKDVESECNARLFIGDNYGDSTAAMRCQLASSHEGPHKETFQRQGHPVVITWVVDERIRCDHGCGQWDHAHRDDTIACPRDALDHEYSACAFCNPGKPALTCVTCGGAYYHEGEHKRLCPKEPFTCERCGVSGVGPHDWLVCRIRQRETILARGTADEFAEELS